MNYRKCFSFCLVVLLFFLLGGFVATWEFENIPQADAQTPPTHEVDPLPSWNTGKNKQALIAFVRTVTDNTSPKYIAPAQRIAVFDNDGTLWSEQPMYVQLAFALDRVKALTPQHPEWKTQQPFQAVLEGDSKTLAKAGQKGLLQLILATHTGMTTDEFDRTVKDWLTTARQPKFQRPYTELVYQPMLELLTYLRANGFKTYIVSGGGIEFMRPWTEKVYGIPPEQVIGSRCKLKFEVRDGRPALLRLDTVDFIDDGPDKPVGIFQCIGRRPVLAFGNSDGDKEMLEWTAAGTGARFVGLIHHTDGKREYQYDRQAAFGRLDTALAEGQRHGWCVVDMKQDWKNIFSFEK